MRDIISYLESLVLTSSLMSSNDGVRRKKSLVRISIMISLQGYVYEEISSAVSYRGFVWNQHMETRVIWVPLLEERVKLM